MITKDKIKVMFLGIAVLAAILAGAYATLDIITSSYDGRQSAEANATMATANTVFGIGPLFISVLAIIAILATIFYFVRSPESYKTITKIIDFLGTSFYYFVFGLIPVGSLVLIYFTINLVYSYTVVEGNVGALYEMLKWIGIIVIAYLAIAGVGYLFKKKIINNWVERRKEKVKKHETT